jgi:2-phosphosulfolactate phosphatase
MPPQLAVHFVPPLAAPDDLAGATVAVIDVLRASTTIVHALGAGAREVVPCLEVDQARQAATRLAAGACVLGGERGGMPIEGFDLGNSPAEYSPAAVGGKTVVLTTTNGTRALLACRQAATVIVGAFANYSAVCRTLAESSPRRVALLCAGTDGRITREDVLFAGAVVSRLRHGEREWEVNDQAAIAADAWRADAGCDDACRVSPDLLTRLLSESQGGRNLREIGMARDIDASARVDVFDFAPVFDRRTGAIVRA